MELDKTNSESVIEVEVNEKTTNSGLYETFPNQPKKKQKKERKVLRTIVIGCLIFVLGLTGGFSGAYIYGRMNPSNNEKVIYQAVDRNYNSISTTSNKNQLSVSEVVDLVEDAVVEIRTESVRTNAFYGEYITEGAGSGVIITENGYIVTNYHVINGASKVIVKLKNQNEYEATVIGSDSQTDLALLKIEEIKLTSAVLGNSDQLQVGETAIAIGNPLGNLGGTVTSGIISALGRELTVDGKKMTLLQTSAAVNPGNSGGGLFNAYGELIGIVNAKSSANNVEGLGFAIPINTAKGIIEELMQNGYVSGRVKMGIQMVNIQDAQTAFKYGVNDYGVYIYQVEDNSPAKEAGLRSGDRIIEIDGEEIETTEDVQQIVLEHKVNDKIKVKVIRNNKKETFTVTLGEAKN